MNPWQCWGLSGTDGLHQPLPVLEANDRPPFA
ncbi:hypothetical protein AZ54_15415 [Xanthomonas oryzae pv. oryzae PXO86]|nr:hypothetical protein AZ54_15415 [Xanthomonas oryzae pv. oryzae PXO86]QEO96567.1 hypothetical protein XOCgx_1574 [Xanthomonas oryzae pv. oryzicola]